MVECLLPPTQVHDLVRVGASCDRKDFLWNTWENTAQYPWKSLICILVGVGESGQLEFQLIWEASLGHFKHFRFWLKYWDDFRNDRLTFLFLLLFLPVLHHFVERLSIEFPLLQRLFLLFDSLGPGIFFFSERHFSFFWNFPNRVLNRDLNYGLNNRFNFLLLYFLSLLLSRMQLVTHICKHARTFRVKVAHFFFGFATNFCFFLQIALFRVSRWSLPKPLVSLLFVVIFPTDNVGL